MTDRHAEIVDQVADVERFVANRTREIAERIDQIRGRDLHRGTSADDVVEAAEHAAASLARALVAHDRCALQHDRTAAAHDRLADLLARHGRPDRAAYHRAAAGTERVRAAYNRSEAARHRAAQAPPDSAGVAPVQS